MINYQKYIYIYIYNIKYIYTDKKNTYIFFKKKLKFLYIQKTNICKCHFFE